jgi:hypothetical protein
LTTSNDTTYRFAAFVRGGGGQSDETQQALVDAGCDDAFVGERDGARYIAFVREAKSLRRALRTALADLAEALPEVEVVRIEPDHLVTMAEIAGRCGLSREGVRLLANGERGPGGFPPPVAYPDNRTRLWHWPDVAHWLAEHGRAAIDVDAQSADLIAALNAAASLRDHSRELSRRDLALVADVLGQLGPIGE